MMLVMSSTNAQLISKSLAFSGSVTVTADNVSEQVKVKVTGMVAKDIRWSCSVRRHVCV